MGFAGSEDAIRFQFEEYVLSLLSSMAYQVYHESMSEAHIPASVSNTEHYPDPADTANDFNPEYLAMWRETNNFALFNRLTEEHRVFDITEPRHPTAGGLNVEDVQRRVSQTVAELHLDERVREGREQLGKTFASGKERVGAGVARFWAEVEKAREQRQQARPQSGRNPSQTHDGAAMGEWDLVGRDSQTSREKNIDPSSPATADPGTTLPTTTNLSTSSHPLTTNNPNTSTSSPTSPTTTGTGTSWAATFRDRAAKTQFQKPNVDTAQLQASARENAAKAGAYLSSWGSWAKERVQQGNNTNNTTTTATTNNNKQPATTGAATGSGMGTEKGTENGNGDGP